MKITHTLALVVAIGSLVACGHDDLGAKRADAVKSYLGNLGVAGSQLTETSRGELDATGATEEGFKKDRRVDIDVL